MLDEIKSTLERFNLLLSEMDAVYHDAALKMGISDSAMVVLYTVCSLNGDCLLSDITRMTGVSKQTINSALRKMEAEDILYLEAAGTRKKRVCLTEKGKELAERTVCKLIGIENDIFCSWSAEERKIYMELTQRYLSMLQEGVEKLTS